jgi:hypothetical protein
LGLIPTIPTRRGCDVEGINGFFLIVWMCGVA